MQITVALCVWVACMKTSEMAVYPSTIVKRKLTFLTGDATWNDAVTYCDANYGSLLDDSSDATDEMLQLYKSSSSYWQTEWVKDYWFGLYIHDIATPVYKTDGSCADVDISLFERFNGGAPSQGDLDSTKLCTYSRKNDLTWFFEKCSSLFPSVCQQNLGPCTYERNNVLGACIKPSSPFVTLADIGACEAYCTGIQTNDVKTGECWAITFVQDSGACFPSIGVNPLEFDDGSSDYYSSCNQGRINSQGSNALVSWKRCFDEPGKDQNAIPSSSSSDSAVSICDTVTTTTTPVTTTTTASLTTTTTQPEPTTTTQPETTTTTQPETTTTTQPETTTTTQPETTTTTQPETTTTTQPETTTTTQPETTTTTQPETTTNEPGTTITIPYGSIYADGCHDPPLVAGGSTKLLNDTTVKYSCSTGYSMQGMKYAYCIDKKWAGPFPQCVPVYNSHSLGNYVTLYREVISSDPLPTWFLMLTLGCGGVLGLSLLVGLLLCCCHMLGCYSGPVMSFGAKHVYPRRHKCTCADYCCCCCRCCTFCRMCCTGDEGDEEEDEEQNAAMIKDQEENQYPSKTNNVWNESEGAIVAKTGRSRNNKKTRESKKDGQNSKATIEVKNGNPNNSTSKGLKNGDHGNGIVKKTKDLRSK